MMSRSYGIGKEKLAQVSSSLGLLVHGLHDTHSLPSPPPSGPPEFLNSFLQRCINSIQPMKSPDSFYKAQTKRIKQNWIFYFLATPWHMEFPGPGTRSELQLQPILQPWQHWILNSPCWLGIKPEYQCARDATNSIAPQQELSKLEF